jgi:excisionase family DNA binding protein
MAYTPRPVPDGFLTKSDAADIYAVSQTTINRWIRKGSIERFRTQGDPRVLIKIRDLNRFVKSL